MEQRYKQELQGREPGTVEHLSFDSFKTTDIAGLDDKLVNLKTLSFVGCGLTSLDKFPSLPALQKLDLSDNKLSTGLDIIVKNAPELEELSISSNKFTTLDSIRPLKCSKIRILEVFDNGSVSDTEDFRVKIFEIIPSLELLDGMNVDGEEIEDSLIGEDGEDSGDDDDEEDGPGLSYLDNSQLDEDETEDYDPEAKAPRGTKRAAENDEDGEPEAKKTADHEDDEEAEGDENEEDDE